MMKLKPLAIKDKNLKRLVRRADTKELKKNFFELLKRAARTKNN